MPNVPTRGETQGVGIGLMLLAVFLFSSMNVLVKLLSEDLPTQQIMMFRGLGALVIMIPFIKASGGLDALKTKRPLAHLYRVAIGLSAMWCMFLGYKYLPLADAVSIGFASPLFMTALSVPLLKEVVGPRRWGAVVVGFIGVLVMVPPTMAIQIGLIFALAGAVFHALALVTIRKISATETNVSIIFYFTLSCTVFGAAWMPWLWQPVDLPTLGMLISVGVLGGFAQLAMTSALSRTPIAVLGPLQYAALVFAMAADFVIWATTPSAQTLVGAGIIMTSGIYIIHRESVRGTRKKFPSRFASMEDAMAERTPAPKPSDPAKNAD